MIRTLTIAAGLCAAAGALPALAQGGPRPDPYGDAAITRADVTRMAGDRFAQLDADHDGSLTPEERSAAGGMGGRGPRGAAAGPLTRDQFIAAQLNRFDRQDADHDGTLTKAERDAFRAAMMARFQQGAGQ